MALARPTRTVVAALAGAVTLGGVAAPAAPGAADPLGDLQWHLPGALHVTGAWRGGTGAETTVAVLDTGIARLQPDVRRAIWTNPGERAGNGVDDDRNGYADDVNGYDFVTGSPDVTDRNGHGTAMAATIAARGRDGRGIAGVAWNARVMALKVADDKGATSSRAIAEAVRYAVANGARVVNASLSEGGATPVVERALAEAAAAGVLVVVAAGNTGLDVDAAPVYPASYPAPNVVAVAATGRDRRLAPWSNHGGRDVDVAAPGVDILAPDHRSEYSMWTGTSIAAAQTSGALAVLAGLYPWTGGDRLRRALVASSRRDVPGIAGGRVDVDAAVAELALTETRLLTALTQRARRGHADRRRGKRRGTRARR